MKLLAFVGLCAFAAAAQEGPVELKHQDVTTADSLQPVHISAQRIERELPYNGILHLAGNVVIRTPICVVTGPGTAHTCAGYLVLRADRADFEVESGRLEASGNVHVSREP